ADSLWNILGDITGCVYRTAGIDNINFISNKKINERRKKNLARRERHRSRSLLSHPQKFTLKHTPEEEELGEKEKYRMDNKK
ncbi:hypothetical protein L9F63_009202, partial [Diploptera punctata]